MADLPHHEHVERRAQRPCHAGRDRDTAARHGEDDRAPVAGIAVTRMRSHGGGTGPSPPSFGIMGPEIAEDFPQPAPSSTPACARSLKAGGPDGAAARCAGGLAISPRVYPANGDNN